MSPTLDLVTAAGMALTALLISAGVTRRGPPRGPVADSTETVSFEPGAVAVGSGAVTVVAALPEPLERVADVAVEPASGLVVRAIEIHTDDGSAPRRGAAIRRLEITFDTGAARAGRWAVELTGRPTGFRGTLRVEDPRGRDRD